jgi:hypothetical protein
MDRVVLAALALVSVFLFGALLLRTWRVNAARANLRSGDSRRRTHDHDSGLFDPDCARCAEPFLVAEEGPAQSGVRERESVAPGRKGHAA